MSWGAALVASLEATFDRPRWWLLALAGFLVRGGLLLFILPIVILPTPAGIANALAPTLVGFVFGSPSPSFVVLVVTIAVAVTVWLVAGGLLAAWVDAATILDAASTPALDLPLHGRAGLAWRSMIARLSSLVPFAIVLGWGVTRVIDATYAEVITPSDVTQPIVLRIIAQVPEVIALLLVTWLAGETAGGLAVRHLALRPGWGIGHALARGWADLLRPGSLLTLAVTSLVVLGVALPAAAASSYAWDRLRVAFEDGADVVVVGLTLVSFVSIWLAGLALVAVAVAFRGAAWTFEAARRQIGPTGGRHASGSIAV